MFLLEIALALALASSLDEAPQALRDKRSRVGFPSFISGPELLPILAKKEALLGLSPDFTGGFKLPPVSALYDALPRQVRGIYQRRLSSLCLLKSMRQPLKQSVKAQRLVNSLLPNLKQ